MNRRSQGFSLIEVMVVTAILAGLAGSVVLGIAGMRRADIRRTAARLAGAMRFAFDRALTTGRTYRIVLDLDNGRYWAETTDDRFLLPVDRQRAIEQEEEERARAEERDGEEESRFLSESSPLAQLGIPADLADRMPRPRFQRYKSAHLGKVELGRARIHGVWTAGENEALTEGQARLHYFPRGFCERAIVQIGEEDAPRYSLIQHPLTGRITIESGDIEVPPREATLDDLGEEVDE